MRTRAIFHLARLLVLCFPLFSARAGVVEDWNEAWVDAIRSETRPPGLAACTLAMLHLAMERAGEPDAARAAAAQELGLALFPSRSARWEELRARQPALSAAESDRALASARAVLAEREHDGASVELPYVPRDRPGQWRRTGPAFRPPETPHWGRLKPFGLSDFAGILPPPPPALGSPAYRSAWLEVRDLGASASTTRTPDQTLAARFWSDFSYTSTPPGHWNTIAREVARERRLSSAESALLFSRLNQAMADAGIAGWAVKYRYNSWRPETAVHRAGEDGDAQTAPDPAWKPLLPCPPHPEYVSGHSAFSGAAARVLERYFGTPALSFHATSDALPGVTRSFTNVWDCAREISNSRVWGGIHFRPACEEGLALGRRVAEAGYEAR